ncbi:hypothetical protein CVT24_012482 [Panaeolus cyanescens]|uniref:Cytochrome P450 n=1 Tax=Panaeolus cyanescens TaxID=181874 RepID=A0A409W656_9AGAR|nr:hypothetical protein CVT24_012482 [Panaeolus cyanescens]
MSRFINDPYLAAGAALFACVAIRVGLRSTQNPNRLPHPPGPKGYPIIGNLLDAPKLEDEPWRVYDHWRQTYGDLLYFEVLGQPFLILGSLEVVQDLFDRKSSKYSSRPNLPMIRDLMGWDFDFAFHPYGSLWRKDRRAFHDQFHAGVVQMYQPMQLKEAHVFLNLLLTEPDGFLHHVRHAFSATIMRIAYGIPIKPHVDSVYVTAAESAVTTVSLAAIPGTFLVDLIPALKYVPQWFPGASFKRKAAQWKKELNEFIDLPFNHVKELMKSGKAVPSLLTRLLDALPDEKDPSRAEEEDRAKYVPAAAYAAGADTTVSTVQTFFLAMAMYPEVARKAQVELDSVVGHGRLPDFSDRSSLPYVNAIVKECLRWKLVTNLALAHALSEDDEYNGYFIPKGTIVMGNAWAILHDPDVFENPEEFIPERYLKDGQLDPSVRDPAVAAFGFGRRICPGRYFAEQNLFILVASTLMAFDIRPPVDEKGNPIQLEAIHIPGLLSYPAPFKCQITPRSANISKLIQDSLLDSE